MNEYFRITAYSPSEDYSLIIDSYGKFEKLWQFSAYLVSKGFKVLEVTKDENLIDGNIPRAQPNHTQLILRACCKGKPTYKNLDLHGRIIKTVVISSRHYSIQP